MSALTLRPFAPGDAGAVRVDGLFPQSAHGDRTRVAVRDGRVVGAVGTVLAPPWMYIWPLVTDDDEAARVLLEAALLCRTPEVARARVGVRPGEEAKRRALLARGFTTSIEFHELAHDLAHDSSGAPSSGSELLRHTGGAIDREPLRALHDLTFAEIDNTAPLDPADLAAMLDGPTAWPEATAVWAAPGGELAGFVIGLRGEDDRGRFGVLEAIGVAPAARGRGLARLMAEWLLAQARTAGMAEVRSVVAGSNAASLALHRAIGFVERARKQMYDLAGV
ncbi:MAG TPA: GNAT family N-acetyltransferase [Kofleriaceae bacterium]|nr:GNAT family N-acetyltransferase [Kofleriaceae bacterium]